MGSSRPRLPPTLGGVTTESLNVISDHLSGDAALDTATSRAILLRVGSGDLPETLQVGMPHRVVAFGKQDALSNSFPQAVDVAIRHGYDPTVRIAGGRAVVFHPGTVRFAWTVADPNPASTMHARFARLADAVVQTLSVFGIAGEVGELENEYCAGIYSVHLEGGAKVMGVGQRLSRTAAQVGGMIVVRDSVPINEVLVPVYELLGIPLDPRATGSIADAADISPASVSDQLATQLAAGRSIIPTTPGEDTARLALTLRSDHVPSPLA